MSTDSYGDIPDFGSLYDSVPAYAARADAAFYATLAAESGGPVLELGLRYGASASADRESGNSTDESPEMVVVAVKNPASS